MRHSWQLCLLAPLSLCSAASDARAADPRPGAANNPLAAYPLICSPTLAIGLCLRRIVAPRPGRLHRQSKSPHRRHHLRPQISSSWQS